RGYVVDSDPKKDEKDPKEDPDYYPADRGNNDDDESSNDDDDDDDVEKDEEDKEEEEHPAPTDPSDVSTDDLETMTTVNQGMSVEEIERVVAQRVANAIEAIAIYETKTNLAHKSMSQTEQQEEKLAKNASNKRKWEMTLDLHAHTFLFEYIRVVEVLIVGYEHVVMNYGSAGNRYLYSPLMFPAIKQLAIKWWDEYGFVIHP
nr:hypothetical protein [Tanacetum cinerariifolium]